MARTRDYQEALLEALKDPEEAKVYLEVALEEYEEDNDKEAFLLAQRNVAEHKAVSRPSPGEQT